MAIIKISKKESSYFSVEKHCIENTSLSWQARGLHCYLMSKPDNWEIIIKNLIGSGPAGKNAVYGMLKELKEAGFIVERKKIDPKTKRFTGNVYEVFEVPQKVSNPGEDITEEVLNPVSRFSGTGNTESGMTDSGNPPLINNDNNKYKNNNHKINLGDSYPMGKAEPAQPEDDSVDCFFDKQTLLERIGQSLTPEQMNFVQQRFSELQAELGSKISSPQTLLDEIAFCLLDANALKECEQNLYRKLGAISSLIRSGKWRTPFGMLAKARKVDEGANSAQQEKLAHIKAQLNEVKAQRNTLQRVQDSDKNYLETLKAITDEAMRRDAEQTAKRQMQNRQQEIRVLSEEESKLLIQLKVFEKRGSHTGVQV